MGVSEMDVTVILLRLVHVLCGVFWAGALMFVVLFLEPSIRASGPEGAKVMRALIQRKYLNVIPIVGVLTILSGLWLMWIFSGGFAAAWFRSGAGMVLTLGSVTAFVAFMIGVHVLRPTVLRIGPSMVRGSGGSAPSWAMRACCCAPMFTRACSARRECAGWRSSRPSTPTT